MTMRRSWSNGTLADARFLEYEARDQITLWGPATRAPWQLDRYARCVCCSPLLSFVKM
jgi:hypothetical protein